MKTFELTGVIAGKTGMVASWYFTAGHLQLPDAEADAAARILCRYHSCKILETDDMIVTIWGPKSDNEWRARAQQVARERWPGRALVVRHPDEFVPLQPGEAAKINGVLVTDGCGAVVSGYKAAGVREASIYYIPPLSDVPDPNRTGAEDQHASRTGVYLEDPNGKDKEPQVDDPGPADPGVVVETKGEPVAANPSSEGADGEVVARFVLKTQGEIRDLMFDEDMVSIITPAFAAQALALERDGDGRPTVVAMLCKRAGVPVPEDVAEEVPSHDEETGSLASMTPQEFANKGVREIRRLLNVRGAKKLLTRQFLQDVLAAEAEKARPREDVIRKIRSRLENGR